jgi:hypothetical protein
MPLPDDQLEALARMHFEDLTAAEIKLLRAAPKGEFAVCGPNDEEADPANDPSKADEWGEERRVRASLIRWLCVDHQANDLIDPKGIQVFGSDVTGKLDLSLVSVPFALSLVHCRLTSDVELQDVKIARLDFRGSHVRRIAGDGARVRGDVSFAQGFYAVGEVRLLGAQIKGDLDCRGGTFENPAVANVSASGYAISADRTVVGGSVFLRDRFKAKGEVRLLCARIAGTLECDGGAFENARPEDAKVACRALNGDSLIVDGSVFLRNGFHAQGEVRLVGARIGESLVCGGGTFTNQSHVGFEGRGLALTADRLVVKGNVSLNRDFSAEGEVRFLGANISGNLDCSGGTFWNPAQKGEPRSGHALSADFATVDGTVFLGKEFQAQGEVCFVGAEIGRDISCDKGTFKNPPQDDVDVAGKASRLEGSGKALSLDRATVGGSVFLHDGFSAEGDVRLFGVQIGTDLECRNAKFTGDVDTQRSSIKGGFVWIDIIGPEQVRLSLKDTSVGALLDHMMSWPAPGNLKLDGFVYGRISIGPPDAKSRLDWLALQRGFKPQPYRQLAKVLRNEGDDRGARQVLFEMEHQRRTKEDKKWYRRIWNWTLRKAVGYGYFPGRSLWGLAGLIVLGCLLYWAGFCAGSIVPTDKETYSTFKSTGTVPAHYARFHALVYSADNALPLVKLGQLDRWQPDPNPDKLVLLIASCGSSSRWISFAGFLMWFRWVQIAAGWFLATMGLAAVTGIVRKD